MVFGVTDHGLRLRVITSLTTMQKSIPMGLWRHRPWVKTKGYYIFNNHAKISGATIVASDSTMNLGVLISNLPQVIFSFGTAPE